LPATITICIANTLARHACLALAHGRSAAAQLRRQAQAQCRTRRTPCAEAVAGSAAVALGAQRRQLAGVGRRLLQWPLG